jgi:hypothetical protein
MADKGDSANYDKVLKEARARWDRAYDKERNNIAAAYEDLEFLVGGDAQWDSKSLRDRTDEGRPVLTVNQLPQFVHQVTGDIRQMKPSIKVVAVDDQADPQVADIRAGLIRYIENRSDASGVYFQAADQQVAAGIGHWRILTEYADDSTFEQEIRIAGVDDGIAVIWDPDSKLQSREDSKFCFVPFDYSTEGFKEAWPDANAEDFEALSSWSNLSQWYTGDKIRVAEYWVKKPAKVKLGLTPDGKTINLTEEPEFEEILPPGSRIEERDSYKICRYLMTGSEVLDYSEWPGRHIPIVPVIGEEVRIAGKTIRKGIVRDAKDPQRMYNYFRSAQTEVVALQPKAPFMVTERNVGKYQDVWESANSKNWPYLPYEPDAQNGGKEPTRVQPPVSSQGINEGIELANEDLRRVIGIYDASLGAKSNETSGKAINARQRETDTGTYVFIDNFARAIRRTGQILNDLIPHIYDTERTIRIMGEDGKVDLLKINQKQMQAGPGGTMVEGTLNDVTVGSYDVVAAAGPSYTTRREEAKEGMLAFLQAAPDVAPLILDKVAKAQDWPMADEIAKRIRANIPPHIIQAEEAEEQGASPEEVKQILAQAQQQPNPEMIKVQAEIEKTQIQTQQEQARLQMEQARAEIETQHEQAKLQLEAETAQRQAELEMMKLKEEARQADAKLQAEVMLEREKIASQERIAMHKAQADAERQSMDLAAKADSEEKNRQAEDRRTVYQQESEAKKEKAEKPEKKDDGVSTALKSLAAAIEKSSGPKRVVRDPKTNRVVGLESVS